VYRNLSNSAHRASHLVLVAFALSVFSTYAQSSTPPAPSQPAMREVVDEFGRTVRVPQVPLRIVSLAPSLTETIYALGAQDRLVGDTDYCDYPPDAQKKPKVGGVINPNLEEIAALHPDLVLVTKEGNRIETVRALDTLGIPSYATDAHNVGKNTFIADAMHKADSVSIVDSTQDWPQMSLEEVARLQPEYLVFAASHSEAGTRDFEALINRPGWRILEAVRNRHYAVISDAVNRPAPRIISAIEDLARQLHPAAFQESPTPEKSAPPGHAAISTPLDSQEFACAR